MRLGVLFASAFLAATSPATAQGLFDMLFGHRGSTINPSGPVVRYAAREVGPVLRRAPGKALDERGEVRIPSLDEISAPPPRRYSEPTKPGPYVAPPVLPGELGRFLRDPTLRPGDVVATEKGLMVYRGPGGSRHSENQFVAVNSAKRLVGDKLPLLVKMDRELKKSPHVIAEHAPVRSATMMASTVVGYKPDEKPCRPGFICREARRQ